MKEKRFLTTVLTLAMLALFALPAVVSAQSRNRNDRWDRNDGQRRNDDNWRRNDRWRRNGRGNQADDGYGNYGGSFQLRQTALNAGFADGVKEGRKDRSRNERFDFRDESAFQKATRDYSSRLGDREIYRQYYREAFDHGYQDGYAGY